MINTEKSHSQVLIETPLIILVGLVIGVFIIVLGTMIRAIRHSTETASAEKKKIEWLQVKTYIKKHKYTITRIMVGSVAMGFGGAFLSDGIIIVQIGNLFTMDSKDIKEEAAKQIQMEKGQYLDSKGWVFIAIGISMIIPSLQFLIDGYEKLNSKL